MRAEILEEAEDELTEAVGYYDEIEGGLGLRLKEEARATVLWIQSNPELARLRPSGPACHAG
jgi:hypothetical protein